MKGRAPIFFSGCVTVLAAAVCCQSRDWCALEDEIHGLGDRGAVTAQLGHGFHFVERINRGADNIEVRQVP